LGLLACAVPGVTQVRPWIEVLGSDSLSLLAGKRVGLVTNARDDLVDDFRHRD